MITVDVDLGERAYPIHIGSGLISQAALFAPHILSLIHISEPTRRS